MCITCTNCTKMHFETKVPKYCGICIPADKINPTALIVRPLYSTLLWLQSLGLLFLVQNSSSDSSKELSILVYGIIIIEGGVR